MQASIIKYYGKSSTEELPFILKNVFIDIMLSTIRQAQKGQILYDSPSMRYLERETQRDRK